MPYLLARLSEGSSWAGIAGALGTLGTQVPAPFSVAAYVAAAAATIAAILLRDKGNDHARP